MKQYQHLECNTRCEEVYDYSEANADGTDVQDYYKQECHNEQKSKDVVDSEISVCHEEQKSREVVGGYNKECETVEETEQKPVYSSHYTWSEWVWTQEADIIETGTHLEPPQWPKEQMAGNHAQARTHARHANTT